MKKTIYYWSPYLSRIATVKATLNSAVSFAKYSNLYDVTIINVCGEWNKYKDYLLNNKVRIENLSFNYYKILPKSGFFKSRISSLIIVLISFIPLIFFMKKKKPDFLVIHLITSLPLIFSNFFKTETKLILRISGFPKLNFLRKKLWNFSKNNIFKVTCPTEDLKKSLVEKAIFDTNKVFRLYDPVINIKQFIESKNVKNNILFKEETNFFIAVGRLTKQKNFVYLIKEFKKFLKLYPNEKLLIFGEGELKTKILEEIRSNNLSKNIKLCGYTDDIYNYMINSKCFILSSLWEDPGFVMIESALCNSFIISSDCKNGPKEFLLNGNAGILFESNREDELFKKLNEFKKLNSHIIFKKKVLAKKNTKNFTMLRHFKVFKNILENY